jgi:hypothetical protein
VQPVAHSITPKATHAKRVLPNKLGQARDTNVGLAIIASSYVAQRALLRKVYQDSCDVRRNRE